MHLVHMRTVSSPFASASPTFRLTASEGAPETCRMDRALEGVDLEVKQEVDIWSMGCVYSEVSAFFRIVPTLLRYCVLVPVHASGANKYAYVSQLNDWQIEISASNHPC